MKAMFDAEYGARDSVRTIKETKFAFVSRKVAQWKSDPKYKANYEKLEQS